MSGFPNVGFANHTRRHNRPKQKIFTDYGCWEGVNVEFVKGEPVVFAKRHRTLHAGEGLNREYCSGAQAVDPAVLTPEHDFMMLGEPEPFENLIDENTNLVDHCRKVAHEHKVLPAVPVQDHVDNLSHDCPDVMHGTLTKLMNFESGHEEGSCLSARKAAKYIAHIDPTLCDVGSKLIKENFAEELSQQAWHNFSDRSFSGGCLKFNCLERSNNKQCGFLACPVGQGLDELSIKLLSIEYSAPQDPEADQFSHHVQKQPSCPTIHVGSDYRQNLNGKVCQVDTVSCRDSGDYLIGVRSSYHVLLNTFKPFCVDWDSDSLCAKYTSTKAVTAGGLLSLGGGSETTSIALSKYIAGDCVVATRDRCVRLWNVDLVSNPDAENLDELMTGSMGGLHSEDSWRQVCYAAHPRQLYVADTENLCLFDMRTQNESISLLSMMSKHATVGEEIYCIEACGRLGNDYQCLVATDFSLYLIDQRHCGEPLLQWGTYMSAPPMYIQTCPVGSRKSVPEFSGSSWAYDTMSAFLGNQYPHEVYSYQFCNTRHADSSGSDMLRYSPQAVGPPRTLGSFKEVSSYLQKRPLMRRDYLESRLSNMTIGLEAVQLCDSKPNEDNEDFAILLLQLSGVGDLGYQTLRMRPASEVYQLANIISGKTYATFSTEEEEGIKKRLDEMKKNNYQHWAESACEPLLTCSDEIGGGESISGIAGPRLIPHSENFLGDLSSRIFSISEPSTGCLRCHTHREHDQADDTVEETVNEVCNACGTNVQDIMYQNLKNPERALNSAMLRLNDSLGGVYDNDEEIKSLAIVDLQQIEERGNELAKLLRGTWSSTYEEYWSEARRIEANRKREEEREENRSTFDLSQSQLTETAVSPPQKTDSESERGSIPKPVFLQQTPPSQALALIEKSNSSVSSFSFWHSSQSKRRTTEDVSVPAAGKEASQTSALPFSFWQPSKSMHQSSSMSQPEGGALQSKFSKTSQGGTTLASQGNFPMSPKKVPPATAFSFFSPRRNNSAGQRNSSPGRRKPASLQDRMFSPNRNSPKKSSVKASMDENMNNWWSPGGEIGKSPSRKRKLSLWTENDTMGF